MWLNSTQPALKHAIRCCYLMNNICIWECIVYVTKYDSHNHVWSFGINMFAHLDQTRPTKLNGMSQKGVEPRIYSKLFCFSTGAKVNFILSDFSFHFTIYSPHYIRRRKKKVAFTLNIALLCYCCTRCACPFGIVSQPAKGTGIMFPSISGVNTRRTKRP